MKRKEMIRKKKKRGKNWSKHGKDYKATNPLQEKHFTLRFYSFYGHSFLRFISFCFLKWPPWGQSNMFIHQKHSREHFWIIFKAWVHTGRGGLGEDTPPLLRFFFFRMCFKCANTNDKYVAPFKLTSTNPGSHRNDPLSHCNFAVVRISLSIFTWSVPEAELNTLLFKLQTSCVVFKYSGNICL